MARKEILGKKKKRNTGKLIEIVKRMKKATLEDKWDNNQGLYEWTSKNVDSSVTYSG